MTSLMSLPPELLSRILEIADVEYELEVADPSVEERDQLVWPSDTLERVCRRWRQVARASAWKVSVAHGPLLARTQTGAHRA
jgi:hypothetical protein